MLLLTFRAAENLYALDVARVVEVVPRIDLRRFPHAPAFIAGMFDYRGTVVPVIDLGILLGSTACRNQLNTRIILVNSRLPGHVQLSRTPTSCDPDEGETSGGIQSRHNDDCQEHRLWLLGLIAEQVSDVAMVKPEQVISSDIRLPQAPYLGAIVEFDHEMAQLIMIDNILDNSLREAFFGHNSAAL
jgi:chemotaxis-related protein WspB